jgi:hypothetical protein
MKELKQDRDSIEISTQNPKLFQLKTNILCLN